MLENKKLESRASSPSRLNKNPHGAGRDPEKLKANNLRWYAKRRLAELAEHPIDQAERSKAYHDSAVKRWSPGSKMRQEADRRQALRADLKLLGSVIREIRGGLLDVRRAEKNRQNALAAYHRKAEVINNRRCLFYAIEKLNTQGLRDERGDAQREFQAAERGRLESAYRRVLARGQNRMKTKSIEHFRWRFIQFMKNKVEDAVVEAVVGCPAAELRARFEALFSSGMTWENHGPQKRGRPRRWNVDHIRPLASFDDLSDPAQFRAAWHFSNLQPLWAKDNGLKKDKWDGDVTKPTVFL